MRNCFINLLIMLVLACAAGCSHVHTTAAVGVEDMGERIRTKYKYKVGYWFNMDGVVQLDKDRWCVDNRMMKKLEKWQPDVFDVNGIPVTSEISSSKLTLNLCFSPSRERRIYGYPIMPFLSILSCFIVPMVETSHVHETWPFSINGDDRLLLEACIHADAASGPLRWLLCWWNTGTCYSGRRTFDSHVMDANSSSSIDSEVAMRAMAYGLAVRLKELEGSGKINADLAVNAIASLETTAERPFETPFEIVRCENTTGKDFEYDFVLKNKGGKLKFSDYERVRSAFRTAIVNTYCMKHPKNNPRSLVTDFTRYTMSGEYITGRVSVLTIEVKTVSYDAATRTGRMSARIGDNQFDDVRRCIRNHIEELAERSNIVIDGDALPKGARFYTGNERLAENGLLEVEFRTE